MKTAVKTKVPFDSDKEGIRIVKVAAFCFSIISWIATAEGLNDYVFDLWWEAYLISFGIQSILFVFNLKLPQYFKKMKWFSKIAFVILYIVILVSSSIFSFVYICTSAMYSNSIGYTDADIILNTQYSAIKEKTTDYIKEDMKALLIVAGIQISQMQEGLPKTDSIPFEELQQIEATAKYEFTKPLFSIPSHHFLFNAGQINPQEYMDALQLEESEFSLIRYPERGTCLYRCGNERYLLQVVAPPYKSVLFGTAGGR